jgi:hypothetical protein
VDLKAASGLARALFALVAAAVFATRLLTPAGFMPSFERGTVTIIACPDYESAAPTAKHHHGNPKKLHQPCPYAAGGAAGTVTDGFVALAALLIFGAVALFGRSFRFLERHRAHDRPPLRGPPLTA